LDSVIIVIPTVFVLLTEWVCFKPLARIQVQDLFDCFNS